MRIPSPVEHHRYASSFQSLRKTLLGGKYADELEKPLAFWVAPSDRRLPQAFLGHELRQVLNTPFDDLAATPGVGQKKMKALLKLLTRIVQRQPAAPDPAALEVEERRSKSRRLHDRDGFDPATVSEEVWNRWMKTIRAAGMGQEKLGRLAPSLKPLPAVIWQKSLDWYLNQSLTEIRRLKTHGEKRVRVVLEVAHGVYDAVSKVRTNGHLAVRLMPAFVAEIDEWIQQSLAAPGKVTAQSVRESLLAPLVQQAAVDCGTTVARVVERRLPMRSGPASAGTLAKRMGVTRARIYQLLEECEDALELRWPEGRHRLAMLRQRLESVQPPPEGLAALRTAMNVFFPDADETARRKKDQQSK
jgi:hypothetical protein